MNKAQRFLKKHSSQILTGLSTIGVIATAIMTGKCTIKAKKLIEDVEDNIGYKLDFKDDFTDIIDITWRAYIPALLSGLATITCILGNHHINAKTQASLISAYSLLNNNYNEYIKKTKELYGEDGIEKIRTEIAKEHYKISPLDVELQEQLFFDMQTMRYFESSFDKVLKAEDFLNEQLASVGYCTVNDFYRELGLEPTSNGDTIGWEAFGDYKEIKFEHQEATMDDGLTCYIISVCTPPIC